MKRVMVMVLEHASCDDDYDDDDGAYDDVAWVFNIKGTWSIQDAVLSILATKGCLFSLLSRTCIQKHL